MSGTWVLDSEALSLYLRADRKMTARLAVALQDDVRVVSAAATVVEADHAAVHPARLDWALSRLVVVPLTLDLARAASKLLRSTGLHGHKYAIDAMVVATALALPDRPVSVLTSDVDDIATLLGDRLDRSGPGRAFSPAQVRVLPV
ncbi:type II toxin-antitoxin system VapC family toxin [Streptacidiphilus sp. N1-12]|uniref:Type II toxin-antitoxin system VapC family toxin n=2 Tax=Streptacidiphilus alkalitolerans TaxID=3342712 RepID=A0ABV6V2A9_9ACTN